MQLQTPSVFEVMVKVVAEVAVNTCVRSHVVDEVVVVAVIVLVLGFRRGDSKFLKMNRESQLYLQ